MGTTVFLQKFVGGEEVTVPFGPVVEFLSKYGTPGRGLGSVEVTFPPDEIAEVANVIGDEKSGVTCLGLERPVFGDCFRQFAFEAMEKFGFAFFDDSLDSVYVLNCGIEDFPEPIRLESENGIKRIANFREIWPEP